MKKFAKNNSKRKNASKDTEKAYIMKKTRQMNTLKIILWCMLGFIFLRGVVSCFNQDKTTEIKRLIADFKQEFSSTQDRDYEALAFAQNFVSEYLTYEVGGREAFVSRIRPYVSNKVAEIEDIYDFKNSCNVIYVEAYKLENTSKNQVDVFVRAKVQYNLQVLNEDNSTYRTSVKVKEVKLRVPIYVGEYGYTVEDLPVYVSDSMSDTSYEAVGVNLEEVDSAPYEEAVENFLSAYYGSEQSVLDYFVSSEADVTKFKCLGGTFELNKIDDIATYKKGKSILCIVSFKVTDTVNGTSVRQRFNLELVSNQKRLYVSDYSTKTMNLEEE